METLHDILRRPGKSHFMTIHVKGQFEGEIELEFYEEFRGELGKFWGLYDDTGLQLVVKFNHDYEIPRITNGWMTLREHYQFEGHHNLFIRYLGRNQFHIIPVMEPITPASFPTWHTKTRSLRKVVTFNLTVTEDPQVIPYLTLPNDMGDYLGNTVMHGINLVGVNSESGFCEFEYETYPHLVRFSRGWREFAAIQQIGVGDKLQFNMSNLYENHSAFVKKINQ